MLTPRLQDAGERRLASLYRALASGDRRTLLAFAEFLVQRTGVDSPALTRPPPESAEELAQGAPDGPGVEPEPLPRPPGESVIAAIRRLTRSYGMLDRSLLLHETSAMMSAHVLQGRAAAAVIDDLEALFARHYREYRARLGAVAQAPDARGE